MNARACGLAAALALAGGPAEAEVSWAQADAVHQGLSAPQLGAGSLYAGYDAFRPFANPALLSRQPATWQLGLADAVQLGGDENVFGLAAGYAAEKTDAGAFGVALLAAATSEPAFDELDLFGQPTGVTVAPSSQHLGIAAVYEWTAFCLGAAFHLGRQDFGSLPASYTDGAIAADGALGPAGFTLGTVVTLGHLDLGAQYDMNADTSIGFGGVYKSTGFFKGEIGADLFAPGNPGGDSPDHPTLIEAGITWHAVPLLDVRAGFQTSAGHNSLAPTVRAGFGVPWKAYAFDYALSVGSAGAGMTHLVSVAWRAGAARQAATGPRFFLTQSERTLAVAAFDPQGVSPTDAAIISDMLRNRLIKEGAFNVVEKANMDKILGEQAFQQTGCTSAECAVKLGKVLNVKYLVVGSFGKLLDKYVVSMRVVDIETAKGVYSDEAAAADVAGVQEAITRMAANLTEAVKKAH